MTVFLRTKSRYSCYNAFLHIRPQKQKGKAAGRGLCRRFSRRTRKLEYEKKEEVIFLTASFFPDQPNRVFGGLFFFRKVFPDKKVLFAQSVHIKLDLPQAARLSILLLVNW